MKYKTFAIHNIKWYKYFLEIKKKTPGIGCLRFVCFTRSNLLRACFKQVTLQRSLETPFALHETLHIHYTSIQDAVIQCLPEMFGSPPCWVEAGIRICL